MGKPARKGLTRRAWGEKVWRLAMDAQFEEIERVHGKEAARSANYGWGDASRPGTVDVCTKVYVEGGASVRTFAEFPSEELNHEWRV